MSTLATLVVRLTTDASDLERGLGQAQKSSRSFLQGVGKNVQALGKAAVGGLGVAAGAATGLGAALGKMATDAAPIEAVRDSFAGLAEDAGSSQQDMLDALEQGSSGMIAQRDLMLQFNKASQLVSTDFASQMPDAMEYVGKAAASTGQDFGFLMDSLVTGVGRMSPMILDNLGIQVKLSEATENAAETFGVEAEALTEAQKQTGMMNVVMEKLAENTASMPDVSGSAAAGMASFQASIQNAKDKIGTAFLPVLNRLLNGALPVMETVIPRIVSGVELLANSLGGLIGYFRFVIQDGDYLNDFLTHLPDSIQPIVKSIGELISGFQSGVTGEFATNLSDMGVVMFRVGQIVNDVLTGGFQQLFTTFEDGSSRLSALFSALGMGEDAAQQLASTINSILGPVIQWVSKNVELKDVLIATGIAIASVVIPALASIVAAAAPIIATGAALIAAVTLVRKAWSSNWLGIRDKTQVIVDFIRDFIQKAIESIRSFWENNGQKILSSTRKIFSAISDFIKTVIKTIRIFWENNGEALTTAAQNTWNMIKKVVSVAIDVIKNFIQAWVASLQGDWDGFSTHLQAVWEGLWTIVSTIVKTAVQNIRTTFSSVDWGNVGRAIIKGIANGIKNGAQAVINAAKAAARAALEAAKGILGIDSPSKAFAQVGRNASQGFAVGMEDTRPIEAAAEQLGRAALQATERSTSVQRIEAPVTVNAQVGDGLDLEDLAWRVSEIIGRRSMEYAV